MPRPRVFLSSTFYDLKQVRADLRIFIESLGYSVVDNNLGDIPYEGDKELDNYCYEEIENIDILVSIVGGRFGSKSSKEENSSISQMELQTALDYGKQIYIFIEKNVLAEYETYLLNRNIEEIKYKYVDNIKVYQFIEKLKSLKVNNNISSFETTNDIIKYLREQFAGLFQKLLSNRNRAKEVKLIYTLEQITDNLTQFIKNTNQEKNQGINDVLMIHHPLVEFLKEALGINYCFYFMTFADLKNLLRARSFKFISENSNDEYYEWRKQLENSLQFLKISKSLFDENKRLKYIRKTDWAEKYAVIEVNKEED